MAGERAAGVPDPATDRCGHRAHLPAALVLVADQCLERAGGDGHLVRGGRVLRVRARGTGLRVA